MNHKLTLMLLALLVFVACTSNDKAPQATEQEQEKPVQIVDNNPRSLPILYATDTCKIGQNKYVWELERKACDSLGVVADDMGDKYYDNTIKIVVKKNASTLFARTFKKSDFRHMLDKEFFKNSILDGCRFMKIHEGMVTFSMAVSYPESDMSRPFILNIGPDGSYMILPDDDLDEEYITDSLSSDGV